VSKSTQRVQCYGSRWRPLMGRGFNIGLGAFLDAVPDIDEVERTMNYVSGASLFATREYIENIGLMDERYFLYCEEVDWCLRRGRHRLGYAHDSIVNHAHGTTLGSNSDPRKRSKLSVYLDEKWPLTHAAFLSCAVSPRGCDSSLVNSSVFEIRGNRQFFYGVDGVGGWASRGEGRRMYRDRLQRLH
jgi:N-acetylglucosaminyl-diphospho-decaprenol L-rhamnosyltransferase